MKNARCHDDKMEAYCKAVRALEDKFYGIELNHVRTMCGSSTGGWSLPCVMSD
jgi:hypothetical protein